MFRRRLLASSALLTATALPWRAFAASGSVLPWIEETGTPPAPITNPQSWLFFSADEAALVEAIADRLIPADELSIGGKEAGCALFIDRQLAGTYGQGTRLYLAGPYAKGTPQQGPQTLDPPAARYRKGLAALAAYCAAQPGGKPFTALSGAEQDAVLTKMESGEADFGGAISSKFFFGQILQNVREGYFADPVYGGNKGLAGWKLIGFPGARYDYRPYLDRLNQKLDIPPVSLFGETA